MPQMMTINELAESNIIRMRHTKIRRTIKSDPDFPAYFIGGKWQIDVEQLPDWIEKRRAHHSRPTAEKPRRSRPQKPVEMVHNVFTPGWDRARQMGGASN